MITALELRWARELIVKLYVDDLTLATSGDTQSVVAIMVRAVDFVVDWLERRLRMQVSSTKSKVVAKPTVADAIVKKVVSGKLSVATVAKLLGTDTTAGSRRSTTTYRKRLACFKSMSPKIHSLRKLGVNTQQMVRAAGPPAIMYGVEIYGISD